MDIGNHSELCLPSDSSLDYANRNYFTGLCTVFLATIQEAKDRILQIESIFCKQLFPTFQSELTNSRNILKRFEKLNKDAEEEWNRKTNSLLLELDKLKSGKEQLQEQLQSMKTSFEQEKKELSSAFEHEKEELHTNHDLEKAQLISKMEDMGRSDETPKLREELRLRAKEIAEEKMLQENLLQQVSKMDEELNLERLKQAVQASELERERNSKQEVIHQFKSLKKMYRGLRAQYDVILSLNGLTVDKASFAKKKVQANSGNENQAFENLKQMALYDYQAPDVGEGKMVCKQKELEVHINGNLVGSDGYKDNSTLGKKTENVESKESAAGSHVVNPKCTPLEDEETEEQIIEPSKQLQDHDLRAANEQDQPLVSIPHLQQTQLPKRPLEARPPNSSKRKISQWRETRLRQEPGNGIDPHDDFLDTPMETVLQALKQKSEGCSNVSYVKASKAEKKNSAPNGGYVCQLLGQNEMILDSDASDHEDETQATDPDCAQKTLPARPADAASDHEDETQATDLDCAQKILFAGPADPVFNNADINLMKSENSKPDVSNMGFLNSSGKPKEKNQNQQLPKGGSGYKYIEPVRKKSDREALKGVECKQCKKFYDAVLAEDAEGVSNIRCEHHDEVSRHRYRYIPPATPEGFWNIGFDSDL